MERRTRWARPVAKVLVLKKRTGSFFARGVRVVVASALAFGQAVPAAGAADYLRPAGTSAAGASLQLTEDMLGRGLGIQPLSEAVLGSQQQGTVMLHIDWLTRSDHAAPATLLQLERYYADLAKRTPGLTPAAAARSAPLKVVVHVPQANSVEEARKELERVAAIARRVNAEQFGGRDVLSFDPLWISAVVWGADPSKFSEQLAQQDIAGQAALEKGTGTIFPEAKTFVASTIVGRDVNEENRRRLDLRVRAVIAAEFVNGRAVTFQGESFEPAKAPDAELHTRAQAAYALLKDLADGLLNIDDKPARTWFKQNRVVILAGEDPSLVSENGLHLIGSSGMEFAGESHYFRLALIEGAIRVLGREEGRRFLATLLDHEIRVLNAGHYVQPSNSALAVLNHGFSKIYGAYQVEQLLAGPAAVIDPVVKEAVPQLFGDKVVNGREINVERAIGTLVRELGPDIAAALAARRAVLESDAPVEQTHAFPAWNEEFPDVQGKVQTFEHIVLGMIHNMFGMESEFAWRLNDEVPIPDGANPNLNPGLEITGPWEPVDMAIKQIEADVAATMGPDDEDAAPGTRRRLWRSRDNERRLLAGEITETRVTTRGGERVYTLTKPIGKRPASFHRVPGMHLRAPDVTVDGRPAPDMLVDYVIHALNDFGSLRRNGTGFVLYYQPKVQHPNEALVVAKTMWFLERLMGATQPGQFIKIKMLYEEGRAGLYLPVIEWVLRHWLIGTNVGRWDYTGSLLEMWLRRRHLPDAQNGPLMGMIAAHMLAYQHVNALWNVMVGVKKQPDGKLKLTNGAPIGGMAAVMLYPPTDPYGRHRYNAVALRNMEIDKLRERLIGLIFVPDQPLAAGRQVTLEDILEGRVKGRLYDGYRQSWVATPDKDYIDAGNRYLRALLKHLQEMLNRPVEWVEVNGQRIAPKVGSGLTEAERKTLMGLRRPGGGRLLTADGKIAPWVITKERMATPEKLFSSDFWGVPEQGNKNLWSSLYDIPEGDITIENVQHAFYMDGQYAFQIAAGNLAAAIDDYGILSPEATRFMNDLATYRIFVFPRIGARITKNGWLKRPAMTKFGVVPGENAIELPAGTIITPEVFLQLWALHNEWTEAFFKEQDRLAAIRLVAATIVDKHGGKDHKYREDQIIPLVVQAIVTSQMDNLDATATAARVNAVLARFDLVVEASAAVQADLELLRQVSAVSAILSQAYGTGPEYAKTLTLGAAADQAAPLLGIEPAAALAEIQAAAPRFNRALANVIMDVLKRQMLSPNYLQHSPRVLFEIADKDAAERAEILNAIYYVDAEGNPLFRNTSGQPSREQLVEAVRAGSVDPRTLAIHDYVYDIVTEADLRPAEPEPKPPQFDLAEPSDAVAEQVKVLEAQWAEEHAKYGIERNYHPDFLAEFYPFQKVPAERRPRTAAEAVARLRGALHLEPYNTARANAAEFRRQIYDLPTLDPDHYVYSIGAYSGIQALQVIEAWQALKKAGEDVPRLGAYGSGWVIAATENDSMSGPVPDQQLYATMTAQRQRAQNINGALASAAQTASLKGEPGTKEDWLPLYVMDFEAPPSALHAFLMATEAIKVGVGIFHVERQAANYKVCGHGGGGCERTTIEHEQVIAAIRLAADVLGVPVVIIGRGDATHIPFINNDDPADRLFFEGEARDSISGTVGTMTYADAQEQGYAGEWTDRGIANGPNGTWTPARTRDRLYRVHNSVERAIYDLSLMAPYVDAVWEDTHDVTLEQARVIAGGVHALGRLYRGTLSETDAAQQLIGLGLQPVFARAMAKEIAARARAGNPSQTAPEKPLGFNTSPNLPFADIPEDELNQWSRELAKLGYRWHVQTLAGYRKTASAMFEYATELARTGVGGLGKLQQGERELARTGYTGNLSQTTSAGGIYEAAGLMAGRGPEQRFLSGSTEHAQAGLRAWDRLEHRERTLLLSVVEHALNTLSAEAREAKRAPVSDILAEAFLQHNKDPEKTFDSASLAKRLQAEGIEATLPIVDHLLGVARTSHQVSTLFAGLPKEARDALNPIIRQALAILYPTVPYDDGDSRSSQWKGARAALQHIAGALYKSPFDFSGRYIESLERLGLSREQAYGVFNAASDVGWTGPNKRRVVFGSLSAEQAWGLFGDLPREGFVLRVQRVGQNAFEEVSPETTLQTDDVVERVKNWSFGSYERLTPNEHRWLDPIIHAAVAELPPSHRTAMTPQVRDRLAGFFLEVRENESPGLSEGDGAQSDPAPTLAFLTSARVSQRAADRLVGQVRDAALRIEWESLDYNQLDESLREALEPLIKHWFSVLYPTHPRYPDQTVIRDVVAAVVTAEAAFDRRPFTERLTKLGFNPQQAEQLLNEVVTLLHKPKTYIAVPVAPAGQAPRVITDEERQAMDARIRGLGNVIDQAFQQGAAFEFGLDYADVNVPTNDGDLRRRLAGAHAFVVLAAHFVRLARDVVERRVVLLTNDDDVALVADGDLWFIASSGNYESMPSHYFKLALIEQAREALGDEAARTFLGTLLTHEDAVLRVGKYVEPSAQDAELLNAGFAAIQAHRAQPPLVYVGTPAVSPPAGAVYSGAEVLRKGLEAATGKPDKVPPVAPWPISDIPVIAVEPLNTSEEVTRILTAWDQASGAV